MGADIVDYVELWDGQSWRPLATKLFTSWRGEPTDHPFDRSYALFGFLAGVRDRDVPVIHPPRGLPADCSEPVRAVLGPTLDELRLQFQGERAAHEWNGLFGHSWATGAELLGFDFNRMIPCTSCHDRDCKGRSWHGCPEGDDHLVTVSQYIGTGWLETFAQIAALTDDPAHVRVVYAFNN